MKYTAVEMAVLDFVQKATSKRPENELRESMKCLIYEMSKSGLLKLPPKTK